MRTKTKTSNLLIDTYPELLSEWDYEKNNSNKIYLNTVTYGSHKKAWWLCHKCHGSYEAVIKSRTIGKQGCPYCAGQKVLKGFNDLQSCYPELIESEWDWQTNNRNHIYPDELVKCSHRKASWLCKQYGHSYEMTVQDKIRGRGCPFCSGKRVLKGFNDLQSKYPDLISNEWDYVHNDANNIHPDELTKGSEAKVAWKCSHCCSHYEMIVYNKINGQGCPFCSGRKVLRGYNDLQSCYPELIASEWDWTENDKKDLKPDEITKSSNRKACWHCDTCSGRYKMIVADKTIGHQGCPYCAGKRVLIGFNDLKSKYPELIEKEWDYEKNNKIGLKPDNLTVNSGVKACWHCNDCNNDYEAYVYAKTNGAGCPDCMRHACHHISKQEDEVAEYMQSYMLTHHHNFSFTILRSLSFRRIYELMNIDINLIDSYLRNHLRKELDIYIPELNLAVEYDGDYWHDDERMLLRCGLTNSEAHEIKQELCKQAGIELLFITEHDWLHDTENVKNMLIEAIHNLV